MFLTSNVFYGHETAAHSRGFSTVDEMNEHIVATWNEKVPENGIVYVLGNLAKEPMVLQEFLSSINGTVRAFEGEYDQALYDVWSSGNFENVDLIKTPFQPVNVSDMNGKVQGVLLSYWPLMEWPGKEGGVIHIYGRGERYNNDPASSRINASFQVWGGPLSFQTLADLRADIEETQGNSRQPEDVVGEQGATSEGG